MDEKTGGAKHSEGKIPYHLIPVDCLKYLGLVLQHGAKKYSERNWEKGLSFSDVYRAALGHLMEFYDGNDLDGGEDGSGLEHLGHALCSVMFLLHFKLNYSQYGKFDDRPIPEIAMDYGDTVTISKKDLEEADKNWSEDTAGVGIKDFKQAVRDLEFSQE